MNHDPVSFPKGFLGAAARCGIREKPGDDVALVRCPEGGRAAAVFTRNRFAAAPIEVSRRHLGLAPKDCRALLINAGNANAATGQRGHADCIACVRATADVIGAPAESVLVNSTGVIGVPLPAQRIVDAVPALVEHARRDAVDAVARAIMTTDLVPKTCAVELPGGARVVGIAKGSGMIHPDMATMIGIVLTDADVDAPTLDGMLRHAVDHSFHAISVDGDTSTNDAVFALASGVAGAVEASALSEAIDAVCLELSRRIVADGEGASRTLEVLVHGARDDAEADRAARTIGTSLLVRTAVAGGDPNWGRIVAALGRSGTAFEPERVRVHAGGVLLFERGTPADFDVAAAERAFADDAVQVMVDLDEGDGTARFLTCDLTGEYVRINAEYTT